MTKGVGFWWGGMAKGKAVGRAVESRPQPFKAILNVKCENVVTYKETDLKSVNLKMKASKRQYAFI